jgi:hypothetical protein
MMKSKIKAICLSKTNILAISLSTFAFLKDIQELITNFASHLLLVLLTVILLITLLSINLYLSNRKGGNGEYIDISTGNNKANEFEYPRAEYHLGASRMSILPKIIFSGILFIILMTLGSLYYIKNMGVYYVVIKNNLALEEAIDLQQKFNSSSDFVGEGLSTRILNVGGNKHQLILFNGYISEQKAYSDLAKIKNTSLLLKPYKVGPQYVANYYKKVRYLQNDIFN